MIKIIFTVVLLPGLILFSSGTLSQTTNRDSILFYTQQLINGIAAGDTTAWNSYLDDSCLITSENGSVKSKQEFIKGIGTPPSYYKVSETIVNPVFKFHTNVIVFCYTADLLLEAYGQKRLTEICQTDTWIKKNNHWRLISSAALDKPDFPEAQKVLAPIINEITGVYQINETLGYRVFQDSAKLYIQRFGGKKNELICESDYVFYLAGSPLLRYIFIHDNDNKIVQLKVRRAGEGFIFNKIR
jgi:Domain of unknown function (DUF4440)